MIDELIKRIPIVTDMISENHARIIMQNLLKVIVKQVSGDIVELGCNVGTASVFIQSILKQIDTERKFHVYDSFEGLPDSAKQDDTEKRTAKPGDLKVPKDWFIKHFQELELPLPVIHEGWFKDQDYPEKIAFAFLDGDFYSSIMDSWEKVFPRLSPGAIVCVHDYDYPPLPGVRAACDEFLEDKNYKSLEVDDHVAIIELW